MRNSLFIVIPLLIACAGEGKINKQDSKAADATDSADPTAGDDATGGGSATAGDATDGTDGKADGQDSDDGTDGTDGNDGNDGIGPPPACQFAIPGWWECNPWPNCPESGCPKGNYCTLLTSTPPKVTCIDRGDVNPGGKCDHEDGPFCKTGLCVDGECRSWCNDNPDCDNSVCMPIGGGPYTDVTACGAAQAACDPLVPTGDCDGNQVCYYQQNTGLSSCHDTQKAGKDGAECDCINCCAAGNVCVVHNEKQICGLLCVVEGEGEPTCRQACAEKSTKSLDGKLGACVPKGGDDPDPPPLVPCDILAQDCDGAAQACYNTQKGDQCLAKGNLKKGASCKGANECAPKTTCIANKCKAICDPSDEFSNEDCDVTQFKCTPLQNSKGGYCDE